jgi:uncharacterized membrane protein YkoI
MKLHLALTGLLCAATSIHAQASYKKEVPDSLSKKAQVAESAAATTALARVPKGKIESVELEVENKKLLYSFDIKVPGKTGIEEVQVSALTGKVLSVVHETPKEEKAEAAADKAHKRAAKKP